MSAEGHAWTRGLVDRDEALAPLLRLVEGAARVAVDTEADSLHAYPERLCLLQVGLPGGEALVDGLAGLDLAPFVRALEGRPLVLHGADYDLRLLGRALGLRPAGVFDTMIAARLLGARRFGLADLAAERLGIAVDKGLQKANWARRPLPPHMEEYARRDVRHLLDLSDSLAADLERLGRSAWLGQSCARLVEDCLRPVEPDPDRDFRVKGSDRLDRRGLAVLRELHAFREAEARATSTPPYFVVSHGALVALAAAGAREGSASAVPLPPKMRRGRRERLLAALERGLAAPPSSWPPRRPHRSGPPEPSPDETVLAALTSRREAAAAELGIDPTLIASRATLGRLVRGIEPEEAGLLPWQRALLLD